MFPHVAEQVHILLGGLVPAKILLQAALLQRLEGGAVIPVEIQAAGQRPVEIVGVVALEGKAQAVFAIFVHAGTVSRRPPVAWTTGMVP